MGNQPKVSVIIPVYNAEKYLRQCLDSLRDQDLEEIEIICVDDKSQDDSVKIIQEYCRADGRIRLLQNEKNARAGYCRNRGLECATGEYVHFLDADDYLVENTYGKMYDLAVTTDADIIRTRAYDFDNATGITSTSMYNSLKQVSNETFNRVISFLDYPHVFMNVTAVPWGGWFKRDYLIRHKLKFNDLMCVNDRSFYSEAIFLADRIVFADIFLVNYRINNGNSLIGNRAKYFDCHFKSYEIIEQSSKCVPEKIRKQYLENELFDIGHWLEKLSGSEYWTEIEKSTAEFIRHMNKALWDGDVQKTAWYDRIVNAIGYDPDEKIECAERCDAPLVSVVMPVYNAQKYLAQAIKSAIEQDLKEIELICVDDGSEDHSVNILKHYAEFDKRIQIYYQANSFAGIARNHGIMHAKGKYLTFLDSDDIMLPKALRRLYDRAEDEKADVVVSEARWFTDNPAVSKKAEWVLRKNALPDHTIQATEWREKLFQISSGEPWAKLFRREFVIQNEIWFLSLPKSEDAYFVYLSYALASRIAVLQEETVLYRKAPGHGIEGQKDRYPLAAYECRMMLYEKLKEYNLYEQVKRSFENNSIDAIEYNMSGCKTGDAFEIMYHAYIDSMISEIGIDLSDSSIYYNVKNYKYAVELLNAGSCANFLYRFYQKNNSRMITFVPRKIRGSIRCYREHGLKYTMDRLIVHLHLKPDPYGTRDQCQNKGLIRGFIKCCQEHDARYTFERVLVKLHLMKEPSKPDQKDYDYYKTLSPERYEEELMLWYESKMGKKLNLKNPLTYNEKVQWMKLYDSTPLKTRLADKYLVREWVEERIGEKYLIPLLGVWDSFDEIDFDQLPDSFVLKANHGCGWNIIVKDKSRLDKEDARKKFSVWMKTNFAYKYGLELHYVNIQPKIIAEQYLENGNNDLYDYKVFCFNGRVESIMFLSERKQGLKMAFYDRDWKKLPFVYTYQRNEAEIPRPQNLELLIELSEKLAADFTHVRVDFYILNNGDLKFGEMTFTSAGGTCKWNPPEQDRIYGDLIKLPPRSPIPVIRKI